MSREEETAARLSEAVRVRRLERIGEPVVMPGVAFDQMPADERQPWLDVACAVLELEHGTDYDHLMARLESVIDYIVGVDQPKLTDEAREVLVGHLTGAVIVTVMDEQKEQP